MPHISEIGGRNKLSTPSSALIDTYPSDTHEDITIRALTIFDKYPQYFILFFQQKGYLFEINKGETQYNVFIHHQIRNHQGQVTVTPSEYADSIEDTLNNHSHDRQVWYNSEESRLFRRQNETQLLKYLESIKASEQLQDKFLDFLAEVASEEELQTITDKYCGGIHKSPTSGKPIARQTMIAELKASDRAFFRPNLSLLTHLVIYFSDDSWEKICEFCKSHMKR